MGILVLFLVLKGLWLKFFPLSIMPAVGFWYTDSIELRKFPSIPSLLGFLLQIGVDFNHMH